MPGGIYILFDHDCSFHIRFGCYFHQIASFIWSEDHTCYASAFCLFAVEITDSSHHGMLVFVLRLELSQFRCLGVVSDRATLDS